MGNEKLGIQELKDLSSAIAKTGSAMYGVYADKEITLGDVKYLPSIMSGLKSLSDVELKQVLPEADDLSEPEAAELAAHFKLEFKLDGGSVEKMLEQGFELMLIGVRAVFAFIDLGKKINS